jgi:hypothetical protein
MLATLRSHASIVQMLLDAKADPDITDKQGLVLFASCVDHVLLVIVCADLRTDGYLLRYREKQLGNN